MSQLSSKNLLFFVACVLYSYYILYYINNYNYFRYLIFCGPHKGRHTGVLTAKKLDEVITSLDLPVDCFKAMTTDNAANMRVACSESNTISERLTCFVLPTPLTY
jgi:hypothetical protein